MRKNFNRKYNNCKISSPLSAGGVDLNRNYDDHFGLDNNGSSDNECSDDYRGVGPFSEPET